SIQTSAGDDAALRLREVSEELGALLKKFRPDCVAVEKLYFAKNAKTALAVAEARGVIRMTIAMHDIPCREFNPADVKIAVCGHGTAPKKQVQRMVMSLLDLKDLPKPDDAADALGLAIALANSEKFSAAVAKSGTK
ncbi:crossover junction endodeoxyribonuclease RuvC, partial [Patescibacteria group bacterium]